MPQKALLQQMMDGNKSVFDRAFEAMVTLQAQAEAMTGTFLDQAAWLPEEAKKATRDWITACKKGREEYKRSVDEAYEKLSEHFRS